MKKLVLSCLSALLISGAAKAQLSYGPELGMNLSNYRINFDGLFPPTTVPIPGAHVGGILNYAFSDHMAIEPGAFFSINGIKYKYELFGLASASIVAHINTIRVPVNVLYTFNGNKGRFFAGAGPFFGINLGGSAKVSASVAGLGALGGGGSLSFDSTGKITTGNDSTDFLKKFDMGIGANVGYILNNGLFIRAGYSRGLLNLTPTTTMGISAIHSINYSLSVGVLFGDKSKKKAKTGADGPGKKTH